MATERNSFKVNKDQRNGNMLVLNFDAHKVPEFKEKKNVDWILYGVDGKWNNRYCDFLLELYNRSAKHNTLVTAKARYIAGNGFIIDEAGLTTPEKARLASLVKRANKYNESLEEIEYKCALDVEIFGGYYKEIVWNNSGKDFDIYHVEYTKLRRDKDDEGYWFSEDWSAKKQDEKPVDEGGTGLRFIPDFDPEKPKGSQIYAYKEYRPGTKWYPIPSYIGAIPYAEIDFEIANFHLNNIKSGFNAGTIINFSEGKPTEEEKEVLEELLKEKFTGTDRAGALLITFSRGRDNAPEITHLSPSDLDKQFDLLNKTVQQEIFTGHAVTSPMLFGVKTEGQLGGRDEITEAYELFKNTYIVPKQYNLNKSLNYLLEKKGVNGKVSLKETAPLTDKLSEAELIKVMSPNEIRERGGLEKVDGGDNYPFVTNEVKPVVSSAIHHFSEDDEDVQIFLEYGDDKGGYEILSTFDGFTSQAECFESELKYSFDIQAEDVKLLYRNIIDLLDKNPLLSSEELSKALKTPVKNVSAAINKMVTDGLLEESNKGLTPSSEGNKIIRDNPPSTANLQIMYSYEKRPGVSGPTLLKTSRPFCVKMVQSNKLFSRKDIDTISERVGYDVWEKRGGWYRKKDSNILTPHCRHVFVQHLVKKKK